VTKVLIEDERYPYRGACSCGWEGYWGYMNKASAEMSGLLHQAGEDFAQQGRVNAPWAKKARTA
jgi:hypothetical protein